MKEYGLMVGDILEMPDTEQNIRVCKTNDEDFYLLVLKNGKPFWLDISAFILCDSDGCPAHEVSWELYIEGCKNYKDDVFYLCGKTIECGEWKEIIVPYDDLGNTVTVKIVQMKFKQWYVCHNLQWRDSRKRLSLQVRCTQRIKKISRKCCDKSTY